MTKLGASLLVCCWIFVLLRKGYSKIIVSEVEDACNYGRLNFIESTPLSPCCPLLPKMKGVSLGHIKTFLERCTPNPTACSNGQISCPIKEGQTCSMHCINGSHLHSCDQHFENRIRRRVCAGKMKDNRELTRTGNCRRDEDCNHDEKCCFPGALLAKQYTSCEMFCVKR